MELMSKPASESHSLASRSLRFPTCGMGSFALNKVSGGLCVQWGCECAAPQLAPGTQHVLSDCARPVRPSALLPRKHLLSVCDARGLAGHTRRRPLRCCPKPIGLFVLGTRSEMSSPC